jgi:hypothetical protein
MTAFFLAKSDICARSEAHQDGGSLRNRRHGWEKRDPYREFAKSKW